MLLDTSGLVCLFDADEARHADAVRHYEAAAIRLTHNYVLAEFVALAQARRLPREASLAFAASLTMDSDIVVTWIDPAFHDDAMRMLQSQLDKAYSLCDAASFLLMRSHKVVDALTTDRHFEQAGFQRLLSS
jgi:predicted nucleic acid-binding protein